MSEEKPKKPSYYEHLLAHDIVEHLRPLWERSGFKLRESDGKFVGNPQSAIEGPWRYVKHKHGTDCYTWHHVLFDIFSKGNVIGYPFVPSKCHQCFKVVVRPKTLKQLFLLEKLEMAMGVPCKCGIEVRDSVGPNPGDSPGIGLYGGYFYCTGLQEGIERYKQVRKAVNEYEGLGWEVPVILKRACTEFELLCGDSTKWTITPEQLVIEDMVDRYLVKDDVTRYQSDHVIKHIHKKWIEYAYKCGDPTYAEFTDGKPLYKPPVTYHHLAEQQEPLEPSAPIDEELPETVED
jgi:hypothetical protein